jgi:hypothetical protein
MVHNDLLSYQVVEDAVDVIDSFIQWEPENIMVNSSSRSVQLVLDNI